MLQNVIEALRRKAPDAVAVARAEVEAAPESADAHHLLGLALRDAGDPVAARSRFDRAIELAPDESLYHLSLAVLALAERDFATVDRASANAIALDPNQLGAYVLRIQLAIAGRDTVEAERQLVLAERIAPGHPQLLFAAGQIALAKGDHQRAVELLDRAATERPLDPQFLATLGTAYLRQGHHAFAEESLRRSLALDPDQVETRRQLFEALVGQRRFEDADIELTQWRETQPDNPGLGPVAAELKLRLGDPRGALAIHRETLAAAPGDLHALMGLERALNAIGDRALARVVWEEILAANPGFDPIRASRLTVADDREEHDDVLRRWRIALPESPAAALNQARQDELDGRDAEAEAGYDFTLARAPLQADALIGKAMYELRRDPEACIARLTTVVGNSVEARAKPALAFRGRVLDRLDRFGEAIADWRQAHVGVGIGPPAQPLPDEILATLAQPASITDGDTQVVLLWGPPGSGSERLAAALRFAPGRPLMLGTQQMLPRILQYPESLIARATRDADLPGLASEIASEYARSTAPFLKQGNQGVFDWLAYWDARVVPVLRHALPGLRLVAVLRDPRDLLLNWLVFGAPAGPAFTDPFACAAWLATQLQHLLFSRDVLHLPVLIVDMDRFDAEPAAALQEVAAFADLPNPPDPKPAITRATGPGRLPNLLPAGRWRAYHDAFPEAFDLLAPLAERLGHPRT